MAKSGNAIGMAKIYVNGDKLYAQYAGDGRQIYSWTYNNTVSGQWQPAGWLDNSYNVVSSAGVGIFGDTAYSTSMAFYNNQLYYFPFGLSKAFDYFVKWDENTCTKQQLAAPINSNYPYTYLHNGSACYINGGPTSLRRGVIGYCPDSGTILDYSLLTDSLNDVIYNDINNQTYMVSDLNLYACGQ